MSDTLTRLRTALEKNGMDGVLITSESSVRRFSGFKGEAAELLITEDSAYLFTDFRYIEAARKEAPDFSCRERGYAKKYTAIAERLKKHGVKRLGVEYSSVTLKEREGYETNFPAIEYAPADDILCLIRAYKTEAELTAMRRGAEIVTYAFNRVVSLIRPGISEYDILAELDYAVLRSGGQQAFPPIIASGANGSRPHAGVTNRKIAAGDLITMDFGCKYDEINTDFTRTIAVSGVEQQAHLIYNTVGCAFDACVAGVRVGMTGHEADELARRVIREAGYADAFGHGTGHGVGYDIHEYPRLGVGSRDILREGMVFTIEPGIYLEGYMGVRTEEMFYMGKNGAESFYSVPRELITI